MARLHVIKHAIANLLAWMAFVLAWVLVTGIMVENWLSRGFLFVAGGTVFDLDHLVYYMATTRPLTRDALGARMARDYRDSVPHFYACHCVEFIASWFFLACVVPGQVEWQPAIGIVGTGWLVHVILDITVYIRKYHDWNPWLPYWSLLVYLVLARWRAPAR